MSYVFLPALRIDHVFLAPELGCIESRVAAVLGSDHRSITAVIGLRAQETSLRTSIKSDPGETEPGPRPASDR